VDRSVASFTDFLERGGPAEVPQGPELMAAQ
jgi:hypothetical protein